MASPGRWLLYGANGYTGTLIAEEAVRRGLRPVLAGRRADAVRGLAERLGLEHRAFPLEDAAALDRALGEVDAVLHAAGPFSATSAPMVAACLRTGRHYLDITGEIDVFEACFARGAEAKERGVVLLPGVGFDVVPSDCLAAALKRALPRATELEIALAGSGTPSTGTTRSIIEGLPRGNAVRRAGRIAREPAFQRTRQVPFRDRIRFAASAPIGDVSTAYYSTGIPDIVGYVALPPKLVRRLTLARPLLRAAGLAPVQWALKALAARAKGSSEEERATCRSHLWARVAGGGAAVEGTLDTPEGYAFTALAAIECVRRVAAGEVAAGAKTPSLAFGAEFVTRIEGCACEMSVPGMVAIAPSAGP